MSFCFAIFSTCSLARTIVTIRSFIAVCKIVNFHDDEYATLNKDKKVGISKHEIVQEWFANLRMDIKTH